MKQTRRNWNRLATLTISVIAVLTAMTGVNPSHSQSRDSRPRDLDSFHLFKTPISRQVWDSRAQALRERLLFSAGMWPMPPKTPLHPRVTGRVDGGDFIVENVALETMPGFYLCGNLYRPKKVRGRHPAIVNPHGHWTNGRMEMQPDVPKADPKGKMGEGRGNLTAIGVNLAKQGFVVFAYDMVGYNDTNQVNHQFAGTLQAWLWNVSLNGLQTWNSVRVLDYLESLPYVDRTRIGVTGASGGGSQTFLLTAVDPRPAASVPVNMVSSTMQGGCLCENGPGLRLGTDNVEVAALTAPKPQLLISCTGDWTARNPTLEWPSLRTVYDLFDAATKTAVVQFNYQHNYNVESREAMYAWFGRWLNGLSEGAQPKEQPFSLTPAQLKVWTTKDPMPGNALKEKELIQSMIAQSEALLQKLWPKRGSSFAEFKAVYQPGLRIALGLDEGRNTVQVIRPAKEAVTLIVTGPGTSRAAEQVREALRAKGKRSTVLRLESIQITQDQLWTKFFSGYNRTPIGDRVAAIQEAMEGLLGEGHSRVDLVGLGEAGPWTLFARATSASSGRTVTDCNLIKFGDDQALLGSLFAPGLRRAGDVRTASALSLQGGLCLYNTGGEGYAKQAADVGALLKRPVKVEASSLTPEQVASWVAQ